MRNKLSFKIVMGIVIYMVLGIIFYLSGKVPEGVSLDSILLVFGILGLISSLFYSAWWHFSKKEIQKDQ